MKILVTGAAGFIGSNLVDRLLGDGYLVTGIDNFNDYYDPGIKEKNIESAKSNSNFKLYREDIGNFPEVAHIFEKEKPDEVVHLAARAGVQPSISDPVLYAKVNVGGTVNLLKAASDIGVKQFVFGSSSSVYGDSPNMPFTEDDLCQNIVSPYGASKRSAEFFVESFWHNFGLKSVILRFFTVYGPRGRVDMAPALFAKAILGGRPISKFGDGASARDYTYIEDIISGIVAVLKKDLDFEIINLGNNKPVTLNEFIATLETVCGKDAIVRQESLRIGDSFKTWANIKKANKLLDWGPKVDLEEGLKATIDYFRKNLDF